MLLEKIKQLAPRSLTTKIIGLFLVIALLLSAHFIIQITLNSQNNMHLAQLQQSLLSDPATAQTALQSFIADYDKQHNIQIVSLLFITLFILIAGGVFSKKCLIDPIKLLIGNFKRLAQGEEHIELRIDRSDEMGQLGACFNEININLQQAMSTWELVMESEACKAAISDAALDGILTLDTNLMISTFNAAADNMLDIDDFDMSTQHFPDIAFLQPDREKYTQFMYQVSQENNTSQFNGAFEIMARGKDNNKFSAEISVASVLQKGEPIYIVYIRDISIQKQSKIDMQKSRDAAIMMAHKQSDFMANISHEIRTPMNGILGLLSILKKQLTLPAEQQKYLAAAIDSADRLQDIINNVFNFSQLHSGALEISNSDFLLADFIKIIYNNHSKKTAGKQLKFTTNIADNCPESLHSDPSCIARCLNNLLDNAFKFTPEGEIILTVKMQDAATPPLLIFCVSDSGCGIDPENHAEIFQPFTQADSSRSRAFDGAGIGLYICKQITELMDGILTLQSATGEGCQFYFSIPYTPTLTSDYCNLSKLIKDADAESNSTHDTLNLQQLGKLFDIFSDPEKDKFIKSVTESSNKTFSELKSSISSHDIQLSTHLIHKLKGTYSNIHANRVLEYCNTLENNIINNIKDEELSEQLTAFEDESKTALKALQQFAP